MDTKKSLNAEVNSLYSALSLQLLLISLHYVQFYFFFPILQTFDHFYYLHCLYYYLISCLQQYVAYSAPADVCRPEILNFHFLLELIFSDPLGNERKPLNSCGGLVIQEFLSHGISTYQKVQLMTNTYRLSWFAYSGPGM